MSLQSQFAAKVKDLIAQSKNLSLDARQKVMDMLDAARRQIVGDLAGMNPQSFTAAQLNVLKQSIDRAMETFRTGATASIENYQAKDFALGAQTVAQPLVTAGLESTALGHVDSSALRIAQGYTADLITGLSKNAAAQINAAIQRAFLGGQPIGDIISGIGKALNGGQEFSGLFSPIGARAASITMNEVLRVHSIAAQARLEDAADNHPDLQKQWHHLSIALKPRPGHIAADGQVVGVNDAFTVEGEELMYPRDPAGSAENTINCHCMMAPYFSEDALKPTDSQKGLLDNLGISVSAA